MLENARLTKLLSFDGIKRVPVDEARAGDIISVAGLSEATVANTICHPDLEAPLESTPIDPPTMSITISVNDSPLAGQDGGSKLTSRMIRERLFREAEGNVAIHVTEAESKDALMWRAAVNCSLAC